MDVISYVHILQVAVAASIDAGGILRSLKFTRYNPFAWSHIFALINRLVMCFIRFMLIVTCDALGLQGY
jgi:hypothetical protein